MENELIVLPRAYHIEKYWISTNTSNAPSLLSVLCMHARLHQHEINNLLNEEMNTIYFTRGNITSSLLHKILLQVIAVDFGSAENNCLIHLVFLDCSHSILSLQDFNSFRPHLLNTTRTQNKTHKQKEFRSQIVMNTHNRLTA